MRFLGFCRGCVQGKGLVSTRILFMAEKRGSQETPYRVPTSGLDEAYNVCKVGPRAGCYKMEL